MEESQNFVLKDCHEKVANIGKRFSELERTDFEEKFN
jgi:methionyl-tRNA synthetase